MARKLKHAKAVENLSTSELILETYVTLCLEMSPGHVTLQMIADRAKIAFGTVRYHFALEQKDLIQSAILYVLANGYKYVEDGIFKSRHLKNFNPLHAYIHVMFQWMKDHKKYASFLVYYYYLSTTDTKLALENSVFLSRARLRMSSHLLEAIGRGQYRPQKNSELLGNELHAILLGGWMAAIQEGTNKAFDFQKERVLKLIDLRLSV